MLISYVYVHVHVTIYIVQSPPSILKAKHLGGLSFCRTLQWVWDLEVITLNWCSTRLSRHWVGEFPWVLYLFELSHGWYLVDLFLLYAIFLPFSLPQKSSLLTLLRRHIGKCFPQVYMYVYCFTHVCVNMCIKSHPRVNHSLSMLHTIERRFCWTALKSLGPRTGTIENCKLDDHLTSSH